MVFRMANLKLMTEEEREAYFNRPESLKVKHHVKNLSQAPILLML